MCRKIYGFVLSTFLILLFTTGGAVPSLAQESAATGSAAENVQVSEESAAAPLKVSAEEQAARAEQTIKAKKSKLPNLEKLLNIIANGIEIFCLAIGVPALLAVPVGIFFLFKPEKRVYGIIFIVSPLVIITIGLAAPGIINWFFTSLCDFAEF